MNSCKITVQRKQGSQWPVVLEQQAAGASLALRREGIFALDLLDLSTQITPRKYGTMLGQAIFQGEVREAFLRARTQSADYLSVQLFVEAPDLRTIHWERLCAPLDDGQWNFLLLDQRTPLTLALPSRADRRFPVIGREDLRALVVVACPEGLEQYQLSSFDVETMVASVRTALGSVPCDVLSTTTGAIGSPTLDVLCQRLTTTPPYTLLHLVCHGRYLPVSGETVLYLANQQRGVDPVEGARLLDRLVSLGNLPYCTFLSTCHSASPAAEGTLGGLAQRLVRDLGLPAVLAMTEDVSLSTSQALTPQFYQRLQAHGRPDVALAEAYAGLAERPDSTVAAFYSRLETRPLFEQGGGSSTAAKQRRTPEQEYRHTMLKCVRDTWITGLLEKSLYQVARIEVGLQVRQDVVENRWRLAVQELDQPAQLLPAGTRILDMYDHEQGQMLILGEPGAGKTTLLLELTRDLLVRAEHDESHRIPVIFHLSSWAAMRHPLTEWLVEELNTKYQVPPKLAADWIKADQLLLLLDGLDEMDQACRAACVEAINSYRLQHGVVPIVVCSRSAEYLALTVHLLLRKAVIVQPLSKQQIDAYVASAGEQLASVRAGLQADPVLRELATTPLMLSVLTLAYHGKFAEERLAADPTEARQQVFAHYVDHMLHRRGEESTYTSEQTIPWLSWLARQLKQHKQSIFYIERMQPDWLSENHLHRWYPFLVAALIFGLPTALGFGLIGWSVLADLFQISGTQPPFVLVLGLTILFGLVSGSLFGLLNGWLYAREATRRPAHNRRWPWRRIGRSIVWGVLNGLLCGLLIGFPSGLAQGYQQGGDALSSGIVRGVLFWPFGAVGFALIDGLLGIQVTEIQPAETFAWSWGRMRRNLVKYTFFGLLASLLFALLFGLISMLYVWVVYGSAMLLKALPEVLNNTWQALMATPFLTLTSGLLGGLVGGLAGETMDVRNLTTPNLGIRRSARHGLLVGVAVGLLGFLVVAGAFFALADTLTGLIYGLVVGVLTGVISGLRSGGTACFEHLALRWLLWKSGSIPWSYAHFLDYAAERILLRKVGGSYIFTHRLLLEYFATLQTMPGSESATGPERDEMHQ